MDSGAGGEDRGLHAPLKFNTETLSAARRRRMDRSLSIEFQSGLGVDPGSNLGCASFLGRGRNVPPLNDPVLRAGRNALPVRMKRR
jgi:hypothetical protein